MANGIGRIFLRKSVGQIQAEHEHGELKRSLGALNLVLLGIGCIIGTGIFVLTGRASAMFAGPGIMISFVITGTLCAFVALCYAELASALPVSGSAYYALPSGCSPYPYHTYTYYNCGGAYYQPQYEGDTVVYVTVPDPATVTVQQ